MKKIFAVALVLVSQFALSDSRLQPTTIDGLTVPGTPAVGKSLGFTNCVDYVDSFRCTRTIPTSLYGAQAKSAFVSFDGKDNFSPKFTTNSGPKVSGVTPDKLSYRGIRLEFDLDEKEKLDQALLADGWIKEVNGNTSSYYKRDVGATIIFFRSSAILEAISAAAGTVNYDLIKAKSVETSTGASNSRAFIDSMKK